MIRINLIKTQVPSQIDLPKKRKDLKSLIKLLSIGAFLFICIILAIYFMFIKGSEKINVQTPQEHATKTTITNKTIKELPNSRENIKQKAAKHENHKKVKEKDIATQTQKNNNKHQNNEQTKHTEQIVKKLKKTILPVFSLNIKLSNIPKPIKHKNSENKLYQEIINDNKTVKATSASIAGKKQINKNSIYIKIKTTRKTALKRYLRKLHIKTYKVQRMLYKTLKTYDIFVGGFDSYPKLAKFAMDLKSKGYKIYKVSNINLLFYVCIDKNTNEEMKNRYIKVWLKTPFRILTIKHKKELYTYIFTFKCSKNQLKLLKKKGYYPIILGSYKQKNGA